MHLRETEQPQKGKKRKKNLENFFMRAHRNARTQSVCGQKLVCVKFCVSEKLMCAQTLGLRQLTTYAPKRKIQAPEHHKPTKNTAKYS